MEILRVAFSFINERKKKKQNPIMKIVFHFGTFSDFSSTEKFFFVFFFVKYKKSFELKVNRQLNESEKDGAFGMLPT